MGSIHMMCARGRAAAILTVVLLLLSGSPVTGAVPTLSLDVPNGGETLTGGETFPIRWSSTQTTGFIRFSLSTDGGESYPRFIGSAPNTAPRELMWKVPINVNSTRCRVLAQHVDQPEEPYTVWEADASRSDFTIKWGTVLSLTEVPETVSAGRSYLVRWDLYDPTQKVRATELQQRVDQGSGWGPWEWPGSRFANLNPVEGGVWWTPPYYQDARVQLRVRALDAYPGGSVLGEATSSTIDLRSPHIILESPNGGRTLVAGEVFRIEWSTAADWEEVIIGVMLNYSTNGGYTWRGIDASAPNTGSYDWTVPFGTVSRRLRVMVSALRGEWDILGSDESDGDNDLVLDPSEVTVGLVYPNPYHPGEIVLRGGERPTITWEHTGSSDDIKGFELFLSEDSGGTWSSIATVASTQTTYRWTVPDLDTRYARVRAVATLQDDSTVDAESSNDFYIFTYVVFNRCPVADAGVDQAVDEGDLVELDGRGSSDPDGDPLAYSWRQTDSSGYTMELDDPSAVRPSFRPNIGDHPVVLVFELTVSDGGTHDPVYTCHIDWVSVRVTPTGPRVVNFEPKRAWAGTEVRLIGSNMMGAEIRIGGVLAGSVPSAPTPENPNPDWECVFTLVGTVPLGDHAISITTNAGTAESTDLLEVLPEPLWLYENSLGFRNPTQESLSYPLNPYASGRYKDCFGNAVYINIWICVGIPVWLPVLGWECLGYEIEVPVGPDPIAWAYYVFNFEDIADGGECWGMSSACLQFYHDDIDPGDYEPPGQTDPGELDQVGELDRLVDYMQGAQLSAECLRWDGGHFLDERIRSSETEGLGAVLSKVREAVDSGELGIISVRSGGEGHAIVPYMVVDVNETLTRIYVYDCNRPAFHSPATALEALVNGSSSTNYPPYVEINRTGEFWTWSFEMADGDMWGGTRQIGFTPNRIVNGRRTHPTDWEGHITVIRGAASGHMEDRDGNVLDVDRDGEPVSEIPGGTPIPYVKQGSGGPVGYLLSPGDYTTRIQGTGGGTYDWASFCSGATVFTIDDAQVATGSEDAIDVSFDQGEPLSGRLTYSTSDKEKGYSASVMKRFAGTRTRVYRVLNSTLHDDATAVINTTPDCNGLVFENRGPHSVTFDVEFSSNVVSEALWNSTDRPDGLPTLGRQGITVEPWETVVVYPEDWLNLSTSRVLVQGEEVPTETAPGAPVDLTATFDGEVVTLQWGAPEDDGGSPVVGYVLYRGMDGAELAEFKQLGVQTSYVDQELERGHVYYYALRAVNAIGEGPQTKSGDVQVPKRVNGGNGDGDDDENGPPLVWMLAAVIVLIAVVAVAVAAALSRRRTQ